jgi:hypothetical protein
MIETTDKSIGLRQEESEACDKWGSTAKQPASPLLAWTPKKRSSARDQFKYSTTVFSSSLVHTAANTKHSSPISYSHPQSSSFLQVFSNRVYDIDFSASALHDELSISRPYFIIPHHPRNLHFSRIQIIHNSYILRISNCTPPVTTNPIENLRAFICDLRQPISTKRRFMTSTGTCDKANR